MNWQDEMRMPGSHVAARTRANGFRFRDVRRASRGHHLLPQFRAFSPVPPLSRPPYSFINIRNGPDLAR